MDQYVNHNKKLILFAIQAIVLTGFGLVVLYQIRSILLVWFLAFILMTALNPIVEFFTKRKISRGLSILLTMVIVIVGVGLLLAGVIPSLVRETNALINYSAQYIDYLQDFKIDRSIVSQLEMLSRGALNLVRIVGSTVSNIFGLISIIVLTVYLILERYHLKYALKYAFRGPLALNKAEHLISEVEAKLGGWVRGEALLMLVIGVMSFIGLSAMRVPFALPLAILAGLLELVPNIGPILSAVPAIAAGFSISPTIGIGVAILYLVIQQLENHFIVPYVMKQSVGLNPLITLFCLMTGATLGGVVGAIFGVPIFITLMVVIRTINKENHMNIPVPDEMA